MGLRLKFVSIHAAGNVVTTLLLGLRSAVGFLDIANELSNKFKLLIMSLQSDCFPNSASSYLSLCEFLSKAVLNMVSNEHTSPVWVL